MHFQGKLDFKENVLKIIFIYEHSSMQLTEIRGDLFSCPNSYSLAHCISEDVKMNKGIAKLFRAKFGGVQEIMDQVNQGCTTGTCVCLERHNQCPCVFYLITKQKYFHKPTYDSLQKSLQDLREHCIERSVKCLAMPRIGCGLDGLSWEKVSQLIADTFKEIDINITVYSN